MQFHSGVSNPSARQLGGELTSDRPTADRWLEMTPPKRRRRGGGGKETKAHRLIADQRVKRVTLSISVRSNDLRSCARRWPWWASRRR